MTSPFRAGAAFAALMTALAAPALAVPVQWTTASGGNGHYYDVNLTPLAFNNALTSAAATSHAGQQGYLATVTSQGEQDFIYALFLAAGGGVGWLGATDEAVQGMWQWVTGPEMGQAFYQSFDNWWGYSGGYATGYSAFAGGEPNGWYSENGLELGRFGSNWNDLNAGAAISSVIEYGGMNAAPAPVPLPAAAPLLLGGVALMGAVSRRRNRRKA